MIFNFLIGTCATLRKLDNMHDEGAHLPLAHLVFWYLHSTSSNSVCYDYVIKVLTLI